MFLHLYWATVLCLLPQVMGNDDLLAFGTHKESLLTLEGSGPGEATPHVTKERVKRFLTFNNDESNIRVEMTFVVPFLHIPIGGKTMEGPYGNGIHPVVDVNAKSLITSSILLFMLFFVIPKLVRVFIPQESVGRAYRNNESEWERVVRGVEDTLHVNSTACWMQSVCSMVHSSKNTSSGWAGLVDGVASWVERIATGTSLGEAIHAAKVNENGCTPFYTQCPLSPEKLGHFAKEMSSRYMNHLKQLSNSRNRVK